MKVELIATTSEVRHKCSEGESCDFATEEVMIYEVVAIFEEKEIAEGGFYCVVLEDMSDAPAVMPGVVAGSGVFEVCEGRGPGFGAFVEGPRLTAGRITCRKVARADDPDLAWRQFVER